MSKPIGYWWIIYCGTENTQQLIFRWKFSFPASFLNSHDIVSDFFLCFLKQLVSLFKEQHTKIRQPDHGYLIFFPQDARTKTNTIVFLSKWTLGQLLTMERNIEVIQITGVLWWSDSLAFQKQQRIFLNFHLMLWSVCFFCFSCRLSTCSYKIAKRPIASYPNTPCHSIILSYLFNCNDLSSMFRAFPSETAGLFIV